MSKLRNVAGFDCLNILSNFFLRPIPPLHFKKRCYGLVIKAFSDWFCRNTADNASLI